MFGVLFSIHPFRGFKWGRVKGGVTLFISPVGALRKERLSRQPFRLSRHCSCSTSFPFPMPNTSANVSSTAAARVLGNSRFAQNKYGPVHPLSGQRDERLKMSPVDMYTSGMPYSPRPHLPRYVPHSVCVVGRSQSIIQFAFPLAPGHPNSPDFACFLVWQRRSRKRHAEPRAPGARPHGEMAVAWLTGRQDTWRG